MPFVLKLRDGSGWIRRGLFSQDGWFRTPMKKMAALFSSKVDALAFQTLHKIAELTEVKEEP